MSPSKSLSIGRAKAVAAWVLTDVHGGGWHEALDGLEPDPPLRFCVNNRKSFVGPAPSGWVHVVDWGACDRARLDEILAFVREARELVGAMEEPWNSHVMFIAESSDLLKAEALFASTFHEVRDKVELVRPVEILEVYRAKRAWREKERALGIF